MDRRNDNLVLAMNNATLREANDKLAQKLEQANHALAAARVRERVGARRLDAVAADIDEALKAAADQGQLNVVTWLTRLASRLQNPKT